jgi:hypothetical protein
VYERRFAAPLAAFLAHVLAPDGVAWLAEPRRPPFRDFLAELPRHGLLSRKVRSSRIRPLIPQPVPVPVDIWEIVPAAAPATLQGALSPERENESEPFAAGHS